MWLLDIDTRQLEYFEGTKIPSDAILSHRWEHEEVTFQEIKDGKGKAKRGYRKVDMCCKQARKDYPREQLCHVWVDTCCIDKTSSAELSEAINSMYRWYENAAVCYAYLSDVTEDIESDSFKNSLWYTRGWTLQELLAPKSVMFFDQGWEVLGTKARHADLVSGITGIPAEGIMHFKPSDFCVANLMRFAARRQTTREEDRAYSLLGIFQVNMPLIYGEGTRAFMRLQEEILKSRDDPTILAWQTCDERARIFARSPSNFDHEMYLSDPDIRSLSLSVLGNQPSLSATGLSVSLLLVPIRPYVYLAGVGICDRDKDHPAEGHYSRVGIMLMGYRGSYLRCHDEIGRCLFVLPACESWQSQRRTMALERTCIFQGPRTESSRPLFMIAAGPECGDITQFHLNKEDDTCLLNVSTSSVGVFDIIHMRVSSTHDQFLVFGCDHDWQPFCLAILHAQLSMRSCKPDARIYVPQLSTNEFTVGSVDHMMTLVKELKLRPSQKWDLQDGSIELHVLPPDKFEVSFYLSNAHHVRLKRRNWYAFDIDVMIDKEFHPQTTQEPHRWSWDQLEEDVVETLG